MTNFTLTKPFNGEYLLTTPEANIYLKREDIAFIRMFSNLGVDVLLSAHERNIMIKGGKIGYNVSGTIAYANSIHDYAIVLPALVIDEMINALIKE